MLLHFKRAHVLLFSDMKKMYLIAMLAFLPIVSLAVDPGGLVPCDGAGSDTCGTCEFVKLVTNVFDWLGIVLGILFVIIIVVMGLRLVTSVGGTESMTQARRIIAGTTVGYIIFMMSWFAVDFGLKLMVSDDAYSFWKDVSCTSENVAQKARVSVSGYNTHEMTPGEIASIPPATGSVAGDIEAAAAANGITDPDKLKVFKAMIAQESTNCTNKVGSVAYGCGQITVATARGLDPSLKSLSDDQVKAKLINDDPYNLNLSAKYYDQLLDKYAGDVDSALAYYNGGTNANLSSKDCPGQKQWECAYDSPGCYPASLGKTDCTPILVI